MKSDQKRILLAYKYLQVGGVATYLKNLCGLLTENGYTVYIATAADQRNKKIRRLLEKKGANILPIRASENRIGLMIRFILLFIKARVKYRVDIIHSHHRLTHMAGTFASKISQIPLLLTIHELKYDQKLSTNLWKNNYTTVPSQALKNHLIKEYNFKEKLVQVIPNTIEKEFKVANGKIESLRNDHFSDPDAIYVGFIGRIADEKGIDIIIDSIPLVKQQIPNVKYRIIGDGPRLDALKARCENIDLEPSDIFLGVHYNVNELLALMDICISPSRQESFSIFALEAMRASKPIVASRAGGLPEVIVANETGFLIDVDSPRELAEKTVALCNNESLRKKMGKAGRKHFLESFSPQKFYENYHQLYQSLL